MNSTAPRPGSKVPVLGQTDLSFAHSLVDMGVPVFTARLDVAGSPHRAAWDKIAPSHVEVDKWRPGSALCAQTGVAFDVLDLDPRHGGASSYKRLCSALHRDPDHYVQVRTRSGGLHLYVPPLGLGIRHPIPGYPGLDLQGKGAMVFIPPTARLNGVYTLRAESLTDLASASVDTALSRILRRAISTPEEGAEAAPGGRRSTSELRAAVMSAGEGAQRSALLSLVDELEKRYQREDVIDYLESLVGRIPVFDKAHPWRMRDLLGMLHSVGDIIPDGDDVIGDPEFSHLPAGVRKALARMRTEYLARTELDKWKASQPGNAIFSVTDWDSVQEAAVAMGPEAVFPASGRIWVSGPPGAGKSALGYWTLLTRVRAGLGPMAVFEAEMGPVRTKRLLRSLGATPQELALVRYYSADSSDLVRNGRLLCETVMADGCMGILYDAAAPLLRAAGMDEDKTSDVLAWTGAAVDPIAVAGGFVYVIDHTGWADDSRSRGASGKPAAGDLIVGIRPIEAFRRGVNGRFELSVSKDRDGYLTGMSQEISVQCGDDGTFNLVPSGWEALEFDNVNGVRETAPARSSQNADTQTLILEVMGGAIGSSGSLTANQIASAIGIDAEAVRSALRRGSRGPGRLFVHVTGGRWKRV